MHFSLRRLDLNLLVVFEAVYRHRSVLAASDELAMSPSACSHAIARLRETLSDELFVRYGNAMQPTAQAMEIAAGVAEALQILRDRLDGAQPFEAKTSTAAFTFAATDFTAFAVLPRLISRLATLAPHLRIKVVHSGHEQSLDDLAAGRVQIALGFTESAADGYEGVKGFDCFSDDYVVAARRDHPRIGGALTLDQYLNERHVAVLPWGDAGSVVSAALLKAGHHREVAVELPSLMVAPFIIAGSDLLVTIPKRAAEELAKALPLAVYPAPFAIAPYRLRAFFHTRHAAAPAQRWMREQVRALFENAEGGWRSG
ncbi:LysR family transcriptional regulator [Rhizobium sp. J15]|nr:LysR family transcriptional regulator [Rhizobium sp. J15]